MTSNSNKKARAKYITVFATFLAFMGIGVVDPLFQLSLKALEQIHGK